MDTAVTVLPETWIEVVGLAIIVGGPYLASRLFGVGTKRTRDDETARKDLEGVVQRSVDLAPAVAAMGSSIEHLQEQVDSLRSQLAHMRPIAEVKYPAALDTVAAFKDAHPTSRVEIAPEIVEDLSKR